MKVWRWRPRWWHRRHAEAHGFFWMPCPLCGRPYGGHEARYRIMLPYPDDSNRGEGICSRCEDDIGRDAWPVCRRLGHDVRKVRLGQATMVTRRGRRLEASIDLAGPWTYAYCARCAMDLPLDTP
jgi:hypothetical protein